MTEPLQRLVAAQLLTNSNINGHRDAKWNLTRTEYITIRPRCRYMPMRFLLRLPNVWENRVSQAVLMPTPMQMPATANMTKNSSRNPNGNIRSQSLLAIATSRLLLSVSSTTPSSVQFAHEVKAVAEPLVAEPLVACRVPLTRILTSGVCLSYTAAIWVQPLAVSVGPDTETFDTTVEMAAVRDRIASPSGVAHGPEGDEAELAQGAPRLAVGAVRQTGRLEAVRHVADACAVAPGDAGTTELRAQEGAHAGARGRQGVLRSLRHHAAAERDAAVQLAAGLGNGGQKEKKKQKRRAVAAHFLQKFSVTNGGCLMVEASQQLKASSACFCASLCSSRSSCIGWSYRHGRCNVSDSVHTVWTNNASCKMWSRLRELGFVAFWPMSNATRTRNAVPNSGHLDLQENIPMQYTDSAVNFTGQSDVPERFNIDELTSVCLTSLTMSVWVKVTNASRGSMPLLEGLTMPSSYHTRFWLYPTATNIEFTVVSKVSVSGPTDTASGWTHIAAVYDKQTPEIRILVNGTRQATSGSAAALTSCANFGSSVQIGAVSRNAGHNRVFEGFMRCFGVSERALRDSEVALLQGLALADTLKQRIWPRNTRLCGVERTMAPISTVEPKLTHEFTVEATEVVVLTGVPLMYSVVEMAAVRDRIASPSGVAHGPEGDEAELAQGAPRLAVGVVRQTGGLEAVRHVADACAVAPGDAGTTELRAQKGAHAGARGRQRVLRSLRHHAAADRDVSVQLAAELQANASMSWWELPKMEKSFSDSTFVSAQKFSVTNGGCLMVEASQQLKASSACFCASLCSSRSSCIGWSYRHGRCNVSDSVHTVWTNNASCKMWSRLRELGFVAFWPMSNATRTRNAVPNSGHLDLQENIPLQYTDNAVNFTGQSDVSERFNIDELTSVCLTSFTMSVWVKVTNSTRGPMPLLEGLSMPDQYFTRLWLYPDTTNLQFVIGTAEFAKTVSGLTSTSLVLPAPADAAATASNQHQQHRWIPAPSLASPPPPQQHPRQLYAQLQQLYRRRLRTVETDVNDDDDADGSRPVSSDSGISDCCCINQQQLQRSQQQTPSDTDAAAPACRICLTSLSKVGPSAAANCGHVACLPCLLAWYRTRDSTPLLKRPAMHPPHCPFSSKFPHADQQLCSHRSSLEPASGRSRAALPTYSSLEDPHLVDYFERKFGNVTGSYASRLGIGGFGASGAVGSRGRSGRSGQEVTYKLSITTADSEGSGTDAPVFVSLHGSHGTMGRRKLAKKSASAGRKPRAAGGGGGFRFRRGSTNSFKMKSPDLGDLQSLTVENAGTEERDSWLLQSVEVTNLVSKKTWLFLNNRWLSLFKEDCKTVRQLGAIKCSKTSYEVLVFTGDQDGAGTDSRIFLTLFGQAGVTRRLPLRSDFQTVRELVASREPGAAPKNTTFKIKVYTGDKAGAGTDADVFLKLTGDKADSNDIALNEPTMGGRNLFERNSVDEFMYKSRYLGQLQRARVWHNNKGFAPGWYLEKLIVEDLAMGRVYEFPCAQWLADSEGDRKTSR
uniref:LamGL domain-containing protein n=1 Tax=Macrostomum lignano TaxID=282301 RepID=A0A1I8IHS7_9PLAT